ncbi:MAG: FecR family protein [Stenotrophobium sp.]
MKNSVVLVGCLVFSLCVYANLAFAAATAAGEVTLLTGHGTATGPDGVIRPLSKGAPVYSADIVNTGPGSYMNLKFVDGGFVLLRPRSRFQIQDFSFHEKAPAVPPSVATAKPLAPSVTVAAQTPSASGASRAFFSLLKGGFRAVSGLIGHIDRAEYRVTTPVATIGIRGTDYLVVLCDEVCSKDPSITDNVPPGSTVEGGIVVGVISGGVFVENQAGQGLNLGADKYMFTLPNGTLIPLPAEPKFLRIDPIPNPQNCSG